jgi:hypothetical protein
MEVEGADRSTARRACIARQQQFGLGSEADGEESVALHRAAQEFRESATTLQRHK